MNDSLTWREIIKGKKFPFLILTFILFVILNNIADKGLTYLMATDDQVLYTYNYSLGALGLILVIPAVFFSIWIIKGLNKVDFGFLSSPIVVKLSEIVIFIFSMLPKLFKMLGKVVFYSIIGIIGIVAILSDSSKGSGGYSSSGGHTSPRPSNSNRDQELKKEAQFQARQKQKEADHAWGYAGKQARYNANTHHFDSRINHANSKQREANEAAKRARNL